MLYIYSIKIREAERKETKDMLKNIKLSNIFILCFIGIALQGCAKYKAQKIRKKEKVAYTFKEEKNNLNLNVKTFDKKEFKEYLPGYQAIHFCIKNKTASLQKLAVNDISLPVEQYENIKKKIPKFYMIDFVPCLVISVLGVLFWWKIVLPSLIILGACGLQQSLREHDQSVKALKNVSLFPKDSLTIPAYSTVDTLIFVKNKNYTPQFTATFSNQENGDKTTFNIFMTARTENAFQVR
jgi:hypothetical protein